MRARTHTHTEHKNNLSEQVCNRQLGQVPRMHASGILSLGCGQNLWPAFGHMEGV